jgi:probable F420-dependent oxidoreductase
MRIGAVYPQTEAGGDPRNVRTFGLAMESMGLDHLLAYDHVAGASHADRDPPLWGPYTENDPFHDPLVMFAYLAGLTQKIEFATGVLILPQRQTVLLAKQATDLDLLSGERLRLAVGTGWNYVEYEALGQDFHARGARMDEQVDFLRKLWAEPLLTFEGKYDRIVRGNLNIRPSRQIPIWMGGFTDPAFRRAVKLGDGFIFATVAHADLEKGWARTRELLSEAGRSEASFGRDYIPLRAATAADAADYLKRWRDGGGTHGTIASMGRGFTDIRQHVDYISEVVGKLR